MNINCLADDTLILKIQNLVKEEREILTQLLHHLREIQRRRLFSSLGYKSLFEFTVRHLGYSEDQAYRRISAMRLLEALPEVEEKINSGSLSLTHIEIAQNLFKQEEKQTNKSLTKSAKMAVLEKIAGTSVREAEKIIFSLSSSPERIKPDRIHPVSESHVELKLQASHCVQEKIERLRGLLAHKHPNLSLGDLLEMLCDLGLKEYDPAQRGLSKSQTNITSRPAAPQKRSGISHAEVKRLVFKKAHHQCENCRSTYALEIDHRMPKALGGSNEMHNLRVLCRSCNQRSAIVQLGQPKMDRFLRNRLL